VDSGWWFVSFKFGATVDALFGSSRTTVGPNERPNEVLGVGKALCPLPDPWNIPLDDELALDKSLREGPAEDSFTTCSSGENPVPLVSKPVLA
jgi:hypothetical protein